MARATIFLFGVPRTLVDGRERPLARRRSIALLSYLAVTERRFRRETLAALLWPDADRPSGLASLRQCLTDIRRTLGSGALSESRDWVEAAAGLECDVTRFESLAAAGTADALQAAVSSSRADFLDGFYLSGCEEFESWQESVAAYLAERRLAALERLAVLRLEEGRPDRAHGPAAELARLAPWDDAAGELRARVDLALRSDRSVARRSLGRRMRVTVVAIAALLAFVVLAAVPGSPAHRLARTLDAGPGPVAITVRVGPASPAGKAETDPFVRALAASIAQAVYRAPALVASSILVPPEATLQVTVDLDPELGACLASLRHRGTGGAWRRRYPMAGDLASELTHDPAVSRRVADDLAARIVTAVLGYLARSGVVPSDPTINPPI